MKPPQIFFEKMARIYPDDIDRLIACYDKPPFKAIRINTLKLPLSRAQELGLKLSPLPFSPAGFLVDDEDFKAGSSPWHHAGAFYAQEPSAMSAVTVLDPQPGEHVLDMCAAPGGKSTQIAAALHGKGVLWSNEYVRSRAQSLISNLERIGCRNAVVTSLHPDIIANGMPGYFDRVLVDAPCSGEGMFRREEAAVAEWSPEHVAACGIRQRAILASAAQCVRPGGVLVYSTCTFSLAEDEEVVAAFLSEHPDFYIESTGESFGYPGIDTGSGFDTTLARRIYPTNGGEGHFVARLRRTGSEERVEYSTRTAAKPAPECTQVMEQCLSAPFSGTGARIGDNLYMLPEGYENPAGLPVLRAGVLLGTVQRGRIEPAHAMFMACTHADECANSVSFAPDSAQLAAFLRGEQIDINLSIKGYAAVCCSGVVTGFGKCSGGVLKNHYPKGLRIMR